MLILFPNIAADLVPPYELTFSTFSYLADCDLNDLTNVSAYRGYELTLLRDAMEIVNLTYGVDIVFRCVPWEDDYTLNEVYIIGSNGSDSVIGSFGAYPVDSIWLDQGGAWSTATTVAGLSVVYVKDNSLATKLFYFQSFSWDLYLVLLLLPLLFGVIVYIFQLREQNWYNFVHHFYMSFFKLELVKNLKVESRFLEVAFLFALAIIMTLYTARLTDVIAGHKTFGGVSSVDDLRGARIASDYLFAFFIDNLGGRFVQVPHIMTVGEYEDQNKRMAELVRSTGCSYFMYDTPIVADFVQQECDFQIAFQNVVMFDYGIAWAPNAPEEIRTKIDYGIIRALEMKSQFVRTTETLASFGRLNSCPVETNKLRVTLSDVIELWIIWLCFLVIALITFLISFLLKRCCRVSRTPFDQELRGKREGMIKNEVSAYFCGNILISLDILREHKQFLLENSRYCSEKLNLNPEIIKQAQLLLNNAEEMTPLISPFGRNREDSIIPISPKKTTRLQSLIPRMSPRSPKRSSDSSFPSIIVLESPKNTPAFRKELNNAAKRLNKDSLVPFSKQKVNNFIIQFATRQKETIAEKEMIIKALSSKFEFGPEEMRRRFIVPKINSNAKWLQAFAPAASKKKQPKNKLLSELLYLDYETAFASNQPFVKSVESSIIASLEDFEESNKPIKELLRPRMVESLLQIRRQRKKKSSGENKKRRILNSFGQSAKPMNLRMIGGNKKFSM